MKNKKMILPILLSSSFVYAEPFDECPTEVFLSQVINNQTIYRSIDLSTGEVETLATAPSNIGSDNVNAIAFNETDRFIYAYNITDAKLLKIHKDFSIEELSLTGTVPTLFYSADIKDNIYYSYKDGAGLYKIHLDPTHPDYLKIININNTNTSYYMIDFAFSPIDGMLYGVELGGKLLQFNPVDGTSIEIGDTGIAGYYGAAYFEKTGFFYVVNNQNGNIYSFDLRDPNNLEATPVLFSKTDPSNSIDGARCANAPLLTSNTDFGDAPESYGTLMGANGARHTINYSNYFLGTIIDAENDAHVYPDNDNSHGLADEDGIAFVNTLKQDSDTKIIATLAGGAVAYLTAWLDSNDNGEFDSNEKVFDAQPLSPGSNELVFKVPANADDGDTWMRFRTAPTNSPIDPTGIITYGEVEDYPVEILETNYTKTYYPSSSEYVTLAFEDKWPERGDFDFNDVTLKYRITQVFEEFIQDDILNANLIRIEIEGELKSYGAHYFNGFGVHIPTLLKTSVNDDFDSVLDNQGIVLKHNNEIVYGTLPLRNDEYAVVEIIDDLKTQTNSNCTDGFFHTEQGCTQNGDGFTFHISIPVTGVDIYSAPLPPFDPFVFGTNNRSRNNFFGGFIGEELEIHLINKPMTETGNTSFYGLQDDRSNGETTFFVSDDNLPWGLLINYDWYVPASGVSILNAYPEFSAYSNSNGTTNLDWYIVENADASKIVVD